MRIQTAEKVVTPRVVVIAIVLTMLQILSTDGAWAGNRSAPDVSPQLQRPLDIPSERLDRPERRPILLDLNKASLDDLKRLPGLTKAEAENIVRGRPYQRRNELVTRKILSQQAYEAIANLIIVE
ncbi:MAG: helix-hairpin-helix domain-containing protein [Nitrospira sp.]